MEIERAQLVRATAGREKGRLYYVLDTEGEYLLLADGKTRRVEAPKRKKRKHACYFASPEDRVAGKISRRERITNSDLRKSIASCREADQSDQEG